MTDQLPTYWTDDLKGLSVFGVIKDTINKRPDVLNEIKMLIRKLEFEIEKNERDVISI